MQKRLAKLCRLILSDKNTRNLFFLLVNLVMAFVELFYGLLTNSLGLISDSFHMFFDCSALLLGLAASLVTKWKPNDKFTYGFGRAEVLAGLANGLFLLFIALFIMKEAIERTFEPPEVHHERLFAISVLGFIVNLIGIFVVQHGGQANHHHSGGGGSHSTHSKSSAYSKPNPVEYKYDNQHGYSHYSNPVVLSDPMGFNISDNTHHHSSTGSVALDMNGYSSATVQTIPTIADCDLAISSPGTHTNHMLATHHHDHDQTHNHVHGQPRGQIMQSVFLHIVADTLGSLGVIISALLMSEFGWMIADPLCSLFIAVLISVSVFPLLRDSMYILMHRTPVELDHKLPDCLFKLQSLAGVLSVQDAHFWTLYRDTFVGCLKLVVSRSANHKLIQQQTKQLLQQIGVYKAHTQLEYS